MLTVRSFVVAAACSLLVPTAPAARLPPQVSAAYKNFKRQLDAVPAVPQGDVADVRGKAVLVDEEPIAAIVVGGVPVDQVVSSPENLEAIDSVTTGGVGGERVAVAGDIETDAEVASRDVLNKARYDTRRCKGACQARGGAV